MSYNEVKLYPNQKVDYLIQTMNVATTEQIQPINDKYFIPSWNTFLNETDIMALYGSNIISSFITGLTENLIGWSIYRKEKGKAVLKKIGEISKDATYLKDYEVANQTSYQYFVFPMTLNQLGVNLISNEVETDWWNWCVMSLDKVEDNIYKPSEIWLFDTNLESGGVTQNLDVTYHNNFTRYPKEARGEMNYTTGTLTCLLSNVTTDTGEYDEPMSKLEAWKRFCADDKIKVLKDRKGDIKMISISQPSYSIMDEYVKQPTTITFTYTEMEDINNVSIFEEGDD